MANVVIYARKSTESEDRQILSIDSQVAELKEFAHKAGVSISRVFTESRSAKTPGRPVFNKIMNMVQRREISGLVCWKLDRLARNPVDGGSLIWAVEERKLLNIYTPHNSFSNSANDKFLMQLEFGMAKKYVDDLSDNVRRGQRAKLHLGWFPALAPLGYANERNDRTIVRDPDRFALVRKMWDLMLSGTYTPSQILEAATSEWGLRSRPHGKRGGGPLSLSSIHRLFRNPFYYGLIRYGTEYAPGKHEPMVTKDEYDRVQEFIRRQDNPRYYRHAYTYLGLLKCGQCGCSVTAEHKVNRQGHEYTYYHCTHKKPGVLCRQGVIQELELERQIATFLDSITINRSIRDWALKALHDLRSEEQSKSAVAAESLAKRKHACERELDELLNLRLRAMLNDKEYSTKRGMLEGELLHLTEQVHRSENREQEVTTQTASVFEQAYDLRQRFESGTPEVKRSILHTVGSNPVLLDKKLCISARKPFDLIQNSFSPPQSEILGIEPGFKRESSQSNRLLTTPISMNCSLLHEVRTFFIQEAMKIALGEA